MTGARFTMARVAGLVTVQDGGRPGHMHDGVPRGGALVPELLARANRAVGNPDGEAALEIVGACAIVAGAPLRVARDDGAVVEALAGERVEVRASRHRVAYLAFEGGLDVPTVLSGKGTLLVAGLGGHEGRALRKGDTLRTGDGAERRQIPPVPAWAPLDLDAPVAVVPGPDGDRFAPGALDVLLGGAFTISPSSDRTGTRLTGPAIPRRDDDVARSTPMVPGAIQVPAAGAPIVLGPDHPTTGGYPVIAVVASSDLGRFAAKRLGETVRFAARGLASSLALGPVVRGAIGPSDLTARLDFALDGARRVR